MSNFWRLFQLGICYSSFTSGIFCKFNALFVQPKLPMIPDYLQAAGRCWAATDVSLPGEKQSCLALHGAWSQSELVCLWIKASLGRLEPPTHVFHWGEGLHFLSPLPEKWPWFMFRKDLWRCIMLSIWSTPGITRSRVVFGRWIDTLMH